MSKLVALVVDMLSQFLVVGGAVVIGCMIALTVAGVV